jgi:transcription initiation factor TFIID subunit 8
MSLTAVSQPSPPRKQALPSLEKKLKNASLVQESLQNLLLATEDVVGPDDGEILGAIVNWEATVHPRKRWKLGT